MKGLILFISKITLSKHLLTSVPNRRLLLFPLVLFYNAITLSYHIDSDPLCLGLALHWYGWSQRAVVWAGSEFSWRWTLTAWASSVIWNQWGTHQHCKQKLMHTDFPSTTIQYLGLITKLCSMFLNATVSVSGYVQHTWWVAVRTNGSVLVSADVTIFAFILRQRKLWNLQILRMKHETGDATTSAVLSKWLLHLEKMSHYLLKIVEQYGHFCSQNVLGILFCGYRNIPRRFEMFWFMEPSPNVKTFWWTFGELSRLVY